MTGFIYPDKLYDRVKSKWEKKIWEEEVVPVLPDREIVQNMVDTVYHASFLTEERRRIWFRVVYIPLEEIEKLGNLGPPMFHFKTIKFNKPRIFNVKELLKLAPAADPTQVLIGVYNKGESKELEIWGLIEAGTSWWDFKRYESGKRTPQPYAFTLSSKKPGQISISREGEVLLVLEQGEIVESSLEVFKEGHVAKFLERGKQELYKEVCKTIKDKCFDPEGSNNDYPQRLYINFLKRVLNRIREKSHGGTIIMVPDELDIPGTKLEDKISIKYPCRYNAAWEALVLNIETNRGYYDSQIKLKDKKQITQEEFKLNSHERSELKRSEEMVKYAAGFLASLSAVDGAIVMTDKMRLLGFGAEINDTSQTFKIKEFTNFEKNIGKDIDIELFGTRHRSAFRLCSSFEDLLAFIVSQDGEIQIAKRVGSEVMIWSNIIVGSSGF